MGLTLKEDRDTGKDPECCGKTMERIYGRNPESEDQNAWFMKGWACLECLKFEKTNEDYQL